MNTTCCMSTSAYRTGSSCRYAAEVTTRLLRDLPVADLTIEDPPIEDVIEQVFAEARDERVDRAEAAPAG